MTQHMRMCSALDQGQKDKLGEQGGNRVCLQMDGLTVKAQALCCHSDPSP